MATSIGKRLISVFLTIRDVRNSYVAVVNKLLDKFPLNNAVLQSVGILNPNKRLQYGDRDGKLNGLFKCYKSQIVLFFFGASIVLFGLFQSCRTQVVVFRFYCFSAEAVYLFNTVMCSSAAIHMLYYFVCFTPA